MKALSEQDFYELLDVAPSASAAQIEAAFGRAMAYYGPDSLATYSLVSPEEAKRVVKLIEDAYLTLSDAEARHDYDVGHGFLQPEPPPPTVESPRVEKVNLWLGSSPFDDEEEEGQARNKEERTPVAVVVKPAAPEPIPVVPQPEPAKPEKPEPEPVVAAPEPAKPVEPEPEKPLPTVVEPEKVAVAPEPEEVATAREPEKAADAEPEKVVAAPEPEKTAVVEPAPQVEREEPEPQHRPEASGPPEPIEQLPAPIALARGQSGPRSEHRDPGAPAPAAPASQSPSKPPAKVTDIPADAAFTGELLRRIREGKGIGLREMSDRTRIGLSHLENIEADHYGALPVTVYLRGFLMSLARELRLDPLRVSKSYLDLVSKSREKG